MAPNARGQFAGINYILHIREFYLPDFIELSAVYRSFANGGSGPDWAVRLSAELGITKPAASEYMSPR